MKKNHSWKDYSVHRFRFGSRLHNAVKPWKYNEEFTSRCVKRFNLCEYCEGNPYHNGRNGCLHCNNTGEGKNVEM